MAVLNVSKVSENFSVSNAFVDRFMCDANGSFVKVYLYCLRLANSGEAMSISKIAALLNMIQSDVISALKYWDSVGVLKFEKSETNDFSIVLFDSFDEKYPEKVELSKNDEVEGTPHEIGATTYSRSDLLTAMQGNEKIKQLFTLSSQLLNKTLNTTDMNIIYMFYDYLRFPPEVIFSLLEYCISIGKCNMRYIEKVGLAWADSEINTVAKASAYIRNKNKENEFEKKYKTMFKISGRDLTEAELKLLKSWVNELKVPDDVIKSAYEITVVNTGKIAFKYMDSVIRNGLEGNTNPGVDKTQKPQKRNAFRDYSDEYDIEREIIRKRMARE